MASARAGAEPHFRGWHGVDLGADGYVRKPFSPAELGARLEAVLPPGA